YAIVVACAALLRIAALIRLRRRRPEPRAFRVRINPRLAGRERAVGLAAAGLLVAVPAAILLASGDPPALAGLALVAAARACFTFSEGVARESATGDIASAAASEFLGTPALGIDQVRTRPGNLLVPIRRPGVLAHLATALQEAGNDDVIAVTVRLVGIDASEERVLNAATTDDERRLFTDAAMLAERSGRRLQLLILPASNVFEAIAVAAARLGSAAVYVGESETLTGADQARLLGEAWERVPPPKPSDVRLVVRHGSGRTDIYHMGAHAPALTSDDLH